MPQFKGVSKSSDVSAALPVWLRTRSPSLPPWLASGCRL